MSRITQKGAVAPLNPFITSTVNTGNSNYSGTATPAVSYEANSNIPANSTPQNSTGVGYYDPSFATYVGQKFDTSDGREFVMVVNGNTALVAGVLVQAPAEVTAFEKLAMTVPTTTPATVGTTTILVTNGGTVLNQNQFQGGYLITASGTGIGQMLKIASHQQAAASATFLVNVEDAIQTTLDATTKVSLVYQPYGCLGAGVIISPTSTATGGPVGVTITPIAASTAPTYNGTSGLQTVNGVSQYGLIQCHGPAACLIDSTVTNVGYPLGVSKTTAGTLGVATLTTVPQVAVSMQTLTSANVGLVNLML